jgi:hypothetical protein
MRLSFFLFPFSKFSFPFCCILYRGCKAQKLVWKLHSVLCLLIEPSCLGSINRQKATVTRSPRVNEFFLFLLISDMKGSYYKKMVYQYFDQSLHIFPRPSLSHRLHASNSPLYQNLLRFFYYDVTLAAPPLLKRVLGAEHPDNPRVFKR